MLRRLTFASRINAPQVLVWVIATAALGVGLFYREFDVNRDQLVHNSMLKARAGSEQQVAIYFRDTKALSPILRDFLVERALTYAAAYDRAGRLLAVQFQQGYNERDLPNLASVRKTATETSVLY